MSLIGTALRAAVTGRTGRPPAVVRGEVVSVRDRPVSGSSQLDAAGPARSRDLASDEIGWRLRGERGSGAGTVRVTQDRALRHSGVWACLRLRANLVGSLPVDVFREFGGFLLEVPKPQTLVEPYPGVPWSDHAFSSQMDLDRYGNSVGIIREFSALGLPMTIELAPMSEVSAVCRGTTVKDWRICGQEYNPRVVWHERQYTVGGWPIGLSPIAYGAWSIGGYLSAQEFVTDWFMGGAAPSGVLKNTVDEYLDDQSIEAAKAQFKLATVGRDIFVTGAEWEWTPAAMDAASAGFLEEREYGVTDVCRFLDVPGDMIDAPTGGSSVTYANITQRNVQALVMNLGPGIGRREDRWSLYGLPRPRRMRFNTDALLRMDPQARSAILTGQVAAKVRTPSEARAYDNLPPYTAEQLDELRLFGMIGGSSAPAVGAGEVVPA